MNLLDCVNRVEQVGLARAWSRASNIDSAHRALFAQDHRAAGRASRIGEMADLDSGDVGYRAVFVLDKRIQTHGKSHFIDKAERGRGKTASQNVAASCFPHKFSGAN